MSKIYGYGRVSTDDQSLDIQEAALKAAGCDVILMEKASGATIEQRPELQLLMRVIGAGDVIIVTKLDRLSRDTLDMLELVRDIGKKGAGFKSIAEPWCDTTNAAGELMLTVFAGVAQFERKRIKERQREGIDAAKAKGVYLGRKPTIDRARVIQMLEDKIGPSRIARELEIGESSVFRIKREHEAGENISP